MILVARSLCGMFGVALETSGMLGTLTMGLTMDASADLLIGAMMPYELVALTMKSMGKAADVLGKEYIPNCGLGHEGSGDTDEELGFLWIVSDVFINVVSIATGNLLLLSEQQLVDGDVVDSGCIRELMNDALRFRERWRQ